MLPCRLSSVCSADNPGTTVPAWTVLRAPRYYPIPRSLSVINTLVFRINGTVLMSLAGSHLSRGLSLVAPTRLLEQWRGAHSEMRAFPRHALRHGLAPLFSQDDTSVRACIPPAKERCQGVMNTKDRPQITDICPDPQDVSTCYAQFGINGCGRKYYAGPLLSAPNMLVRFTARRWPIVADLCSSHSGVSCGFCAVGYFKMGKTCQPCDEELERIM